MERLNSNEFLLECVALQIENICNTYALSKLDENDYVNLIDVCKSLHPKNMIVFMGNDTLQTVKRLSEQKYKDAYNEKLNSLLDKIN